MIDLTGHIDPEDMPVCPICDNTIIEWDGVVLIRCAGSKALAHNICVAELDLETPGELMESI